MTIREGSPISTDIPGIDQFKSERERRVYAANYDSALAGLKKGGGIRVRRSLAPFAAAHFATGRVEGYRATVMEGIRHSADTVHEIGWQIIDEFDLQVDPQDGNFVSQLEANHPPLVEAIADPIVLVEIIDPLDIKRTRKQSRYQRAWEIHEAYLARLGFNTGQKAFTRLNETWDGKKATRRLWSMHPDPGKSLLAESRLNSAPSGEEHNSEFLVMYHPSPKDRLPTWS